MVCLAPGQDADSFQRAGGVGTAVVLAVPWRSVNSHALCADFQQGLVIVDEHCPFTEPLFPKLGVGAFACAAFGGEQVGFAVHADAGAMKQQGVPF